MSQKGFPVREEANLSIIKIVGISSTVHGSFHGDGCAFLGTKRFWDYFLEVFRCDSFGEQHNVASFYLFQD